MSDQQTAATARLGRLIASYAPRPRPWTRELNLTLLAGVALIAGSWTAQRQPQWGWPLLGGLGILICCLGLFRRRRTPRRIDLYQRGLVSITGRQQQMLSWCQIGEIYPTERPGGWRLRIRLEARRSPGLAAGRSRWPPMASGRFRGSGKPGGPDPGRVHRPSTATDCGCLSGRMSGPLRASVEPEPGGPTDRSEVPRVA